MFCARSKLDFGMGLNVLRTLKGKFRDLICFTHAQRSIWVLFTRLKKSSRKKPVYTRVSVPLRHFRLFPVLSAVVSKYSGFPSGSSSRFYQLRFLKYSFTPSIFISFTSLNLVTHPLHSTFELQLILKTLKN